MYALVGLHCDANTILVLTIYATSLSILEEFDFDHLVTAGIGKNSLHLSSYTPGKLLQSWA